MCTDLLHIVVRCEDMEINDTNIGIVFNIYSKKRCFNIKNYPNKYICIKLNT